MRHVSADQSCKQKFFSHAEQNKFFQDIASLFDTPRLQPNHQ